jgi:hypothetical protein
LKSPNVDFAILRNSVNSFCIILTELFLSYALIVRQNSSDTLSHSMRHIRTIDIVKVIGQTSKSLFSLLSACCLDVSIRQNI